jgi:hypothetical protein
MGLDLCRSGSQPDANIVSLASAPITRNDGRQGILPLPSISSRAQIAGSFRHRPICVLTHFDLALQWCHPASSLASVSPGRSPISDCRAWPPNAVSSARAPSGPVAVADAIPAARTPAARTSAASASRSGATLTTTASARRNSAPTPPAKRATMPVTSSSRVAACSARGSKTAAGRWARSASLVSAASRGEVHLGALVPTRLRRLRQLGCVARHAAPRGHPAKGACAGATERVWVSRGRGVARAG